EVPRRNHSTGPLEERQNEAAHARVDVAAGVMLGRERGELGYGVDDALRVLRRRSDDEHSGHVDGLGHRLEVRAEVRAYGYAARFDAEVLARLVKRRVG